MQVLKFWNIKIGLHTTFNGRSRSIWNYDCCGWKCYHFFSKDVVDFLTSVSIKSFRFPSHHKHSVIISSQTFWWSAHHFFVLVKRWADKSDRSFSVKRKELTQADLNLKTETKKLRSKQGCGFRRWLRVLTTTSSSVERLFLVWNLGDW